MGAAHATAVYATWGKRLRGSAFRLLVHMALTAKDSDSPPHYWGGRDGMAEALGKGADAAGHQAVKRAVASLVAAGAITRVRGGRKNVGAAKWRVNIFPPADDQGYEKCTSELSTAPNLRGTKSDPLRGTESDPSGVQFLTLRGTESDPHRNTEEKQRSELEEETSPTNSSTDRAREADDEMKMTPQQASRILADAASRGVPISPLLDQSPAHYTTKTQRRIWAARHIERTAS